MPIILITAIGSFSAKTVINKLKGVHYIIGTNIYPHNWIPESLLVDKFYQVSPVADREKYLSEIINICKQENVDYIVPLTDVEIDLLNEKREQLPCELAISPFHTIKLLRDKFKLYKYVDEILDQFPNIMTIPTYKLTFEHIQQIQYPQVWKIYNGRSSEGLYRIYDKYNSEEIYRHLYNQKSLDNYIMQPLIEGDVVTVDLVADMYGNIISLPRRELLRTQNGAGLSVRIYKDEQLDCAVRKIAIETKIIGCVNFEFICKNKKYYFLECNPRFSGGIAFSCAAGYDFINAHIKSIAKQKIQPVSHIRRGFIAKQYEEVWM